MIIMLLYTHLFFANFFWIWKLWHFFRKLFLKYENYDTFSQTFSEIWKLWPNENYFLWFNCKPFWRQRFNLYEIPIWLDYNFVVSEKFRKIFDGLSWHWSFDSLKINLVFNCKNKYPKLWYRSDIVLMIIMCSLTKIWYVQTHYFDTIFFWNYFLWFVEKPF